jgi:hypothetical protein
MTTTNILSLVGAAIAGGAISFYLTRKFDKKLMQEQEQEFNTVYNDLKNRYYAALSKNSSNNDEVVQSVKQVEEVYENAMKAMHTYEGSTVQPVSPYNETEFSSDSADSEYPREKDRSNDRIISEASVGKGGYQVVQLYWYKLSGNLIQENGESAMDLIDDPIPMSVIESATTDKVAYRVEDDDCDYVIDILDKFYYEIEDVTGQEKVTLDTDRSIYEINKIEYENEAYFTAKDGSRVDWDKYHLTYYPNSHVIYNNLTGEYYDEIEVEDYLCNSTLLMMNADTELSFYIRNQNIMADIFIEASDEDFYALNEEKIESDAIFTGDWERTSEPDLYFVEKLKEMLV